MVPWRTSRRKRTAARSMTSVSGTAVELRRRAPFKPLMRPLRVRVASVLVEVELRRQRREQDVPKQLPSYERSPAPRSSSSAGSEPGNLLLDLQHVQLAWKSENCGPWSWTSSGLRFVRRAPR